jgi:hypothetical protein
MQHDRDSYITQALEEFVRETQTLLDAALAHKADDDMHDEIAFWKAQRNAFVKAQHYFARGVRLTATPAVTPCPQPAARIRSTGCTRSATLATSGHARARPASAACFTGTRRWSQHTSAAPSLCLAS